jgi:vancomycin resistance protein YoaR
MLKRGDAARTVSLRSTITPANLTTAEARAMGIHARISTFSTTYDGSNAPRTNNIHTLGSALDGKLIPPGGTFSFNKYVGERTAAKGYQEANAIVKGKLVPQLGGGICQVGTTLFNTVFFSGMPVLERENHSFYISHYPKGRDATVSWGGPDLRWKNTTASWMLLSVSYSSDSITMSLYGTNPGYDVTYTTGDFTNITPFPTEQVKDPTLANGLKVVQDPGEDGCSLVVVRTVKKGSTVIRTDTFRSLYKPKIQVVRVGTAGKPSKTTTPTPSKG